MTDPKIGEVYAPRGYAVESATIYTVIGLPNLKGKWVTAVRMWTNKVYSFPGKEFDEKFRRVE